MKMMAADLNFTYNERTHVVYPVTEDIIKSVGFLVYVPNQSSFQDGEFYPSQYRCQVRTNGGVGTVLVVTVCHGVLQAMFRTNDSYLSLPHKMNLIEHDLVFFDTIKARECVQYLLSQPNTALLNFEDTLFKLAYDVSEERYRRTRLEYMHSRDKLT